MIPKETGNNVYAKFWVEKQRVLWYFWYWLIRRALFFLKNIHFLVLKNAYLTLARENAIDGGCT